MMSSSTFVFILSLLVTIEGSPRNTSRVPAGSQRNVTTVAGKGIPKKATAVVTVVSARDLIKADRIGNSDPYAVLVYGKQMSKTDIVRNNQNPTWNFEAEFDVLDGKVQPIQIKVYDRD